MRINASTNRYSDIIKQHLAKDINDPYTILLALLEEFINMAKKKSFLYFNTHKHAAFCKSCFADKKKTEQKRSEEKSVQTTKQKLAPKFDNIKATLDALNTYCKGKEIDSSGEFAMMLQAFFSVYSHFDLEKSLKSELPSTDCLEIFMDVPRLEAKLSESLVRGSEDEEELAKGVKLLFRLMSTQQKKAWVAAQLQDLRDTKKGLLERVRFYACFKLYESRNDIPAACWPEIIACLTDCLSQGNFGKLYPPAYSLMAENASYIPKSLWPKVIEKFLAFSELLSASDVDVYSLFTGDAATYIPEELWPTIIEQIYKTPNNDVRNIISNHFNQVPKDVMPNFLKILVKQLCFSLSGGWANDERLLNQCLPLLNKDQWDKEIIPFVLMRYSFGHISWDQSTLVKRIVPHIPKDSSLWPALIEKVFFKDCRSSALGDIWAIFAAHIPAKYWNGIITALSSKWQEQPFEAIFNVCAPHIPVSEWRSIFTIIKSQVAGESKDSKEYEDSKDSDAKSMSNLKYPINTVRALFLGLGVMADDLKMEVVQWLVDEFIKSTDKNRAKVHMHFFCSLFSQASPHVPKNLIPKMVDTLLPLLGDEQWDDRYPCSDSVVFASLAEYVKLFAVQKDHAKLWTEFLNNFFKLIEINKEKAKDSKSYYDALTELANIIPKDHWQSVIERLITHLQTDFADYARDTLIKCMPYIPAAAKLHVFKGIITSLQGDHFDKTFTVDVRLGKIINELPEDSRSDFINVLLSELENIRTRSIIFGTLIHCREVIPTALLGDVSKAFLKYDADIFTFLNPTVAQRIPSEVRPQIIEASSKLLMSEEKDQKRTNRQQIQVKASIAMAHYPDLIPELLRPKVISTLIAELDDENMDVIIVAARSLVACHEFLGIENWEIIIEKLNVILKDHYRDVNQENLFTLFEELAPKIPQESWQVFIFALSIPPGSWSKWSNLAEVAGKVLTKCIIHLPKELRFDFCKDLLVNIRQHNYRTSNPLIEVFHKLVPMLERHEYIYIMSSLADKITNCEKEKKEEGNDWFNDTVADQLQLLADVHEKVGVERALDAVLPENIEKIVLGLLG